MATFDRVCVCVCIYTTHSYSYSHARERPTVVEGGGFARAELGGAFRFQFPIVVGGGDGDTSARVSRAARGCRAHARAGASRTSHAIGGVCVRRAEGDGARAVDVARARDRGGVQVA